MNEVEPGTHELYKEHTVYNYQREATPCDYVSHTLEMERNVCI